MKQETPARVWPRDIYEVFKQVGIEQIAFVPDAGHTQLIKDCEADNTIEAVSLTSEEEGVAMLAGAWLGGKRGALLMQSSGVGNCINMLSIIQECRFPLLMIVTMRGEWGEFNPWQLPMGQSTQQVLEQCRRHRAARRSCRRRSRRGLCGGADDVQLEPPGRRAARPAPDRFQGLEQVVMADKDQGTMDRRAVMGAMLEARGDA